MSAEWRPRDVAVLVCASYALFVVLVVAFDDPRERVRLAGDNPSYAYAAGAIRGAWPADGSPRHFLGYPLAAAPIAALTGDDFSALVIVSAISSPVAVALATTLWGALPAALFAVVNLDWLQRSLTGGAEPLFAALLFGAFVQARRERWALAALLASLATFVRPTGVFALLAMILFLLARRRARELAAVVIVAMLAGTGYLLAAESFFGAASGAFAWYERMGLGRDAAFVPFVSLRSSWEAGLLTSKSAAKAFAWMLLTAAGVFAFFLRRREPFAREHRFEWTFAVIWLASFLLFPAWWIEGEYPRYLVPVIPMLFVTLEPWLPRERWLVWTLALSSSAIAALDGVLF